MDAVHATISLCNPVCPECEPIDVACLVDTSVTHLLLPESIAIQLQLEILQDRKVNFVNGSSHMVPYAGPVQINFKNRVCFVGALIMGDEVLLGAVPMEDMDLVVIPKLLKLDVNPESPNFARGLAK